MSTDTVGSTPPWAVMDKYDPELHDDDSDDDSYAPTPLTQAIMAAAIMITIGLAFVGAASILQSIAAGLS